VCEFDGVIYFRAVNGQSRAMSSLAALTASILARRRLFLHGVN
jgi:hypothetical protein